MRAHEAERRATANGSVAEQWRCCCCGGGGGDGDGGDDDDDYNEQHWRSGTITASEDSAA